MVTLIAPFGIDPAAREQEPSGTEAIAIPGVTVISERLLLIDKALLLPEGILVRGSDRAALVITAAIRLPDLAEPEAITSLLTGLVEVGVTQAVAIPLEPGAIVLARVILREVEAAVRAEAVIHPGHEVLQVVAHACLQVVVDQEALHPAEAAVQDQEVEETNILYFVQPKLGVSSI